jgi:chorismate mutase / prephenate dehydratase
MESVTSGTELEQVVRPGRVGYLGPPGTFSYQAALQHFGPSAVLVPCRTIADVFTEAERRAVDYGVVPVENSTEGAVPNAVDRFLETDLLVCAEVGVRVSHFLMSNGRLDQIKQVYSHPQGLAQCRRWLAEHLPNAIQVETASTAGAAQLARSVDTAAIAPEAASALYDLPIIESRIEDIATNITRFLVIGQQMATRTGHDRTAIVFSVPDRAGALVAALNCFARHDISLSRIESRPSRRRPWEYVFFVDFGGHPDDDVVALGLSELRDMSEFVRVLGTWSIERPESIRQ